MFFSPKVSVVCVSDESNDSHLVLTHFHTKTAVYDKLGYRIFGVHFSWFCKIFWFLSFYTIFYVSKYFIEGVATSLILYVRTKTYWLCLVLSFSRKHRLVLKIMYSNTYNRIVLLSESFEFDNGDFVIAMIHMNIIFTTRSATIQVKWYVSFQRHISENYPVCSSSYLFHIMIDIWTVIDIKYIMAKLLQFRRYHQSVYGNNIRKWDKFLH